MTTGASPPKYTPILPGDRMHLSKNKCITTQKKHRNVTILRVGRGKNEQQLQDIAASRRIPGLIHADIKLKGPGREKLRSMRGSIVVMNKIMPIVKE